MIGLTSIDKEINGTNINYVIGGKGDVLVVLPGFPSGFYPDNEFLEFLSTKLKIIAINIPGFGISHALNGKTGFDEMAKVINKLLVELKINKFSIFGFSFGGGLALTVAQKFPDKIFKVCVVSPLLGSKYLVARARLIFSAINLLFTFAPKVTETMTKKILNSHIASAAYQIVTKYDVKSAGGKKNENTDLDNLKKMDLASCLSVFNAQKETDLLNNKVSRPLMVIYSEKDSFVGNSPFYLSQVSSEAEIINITGQHWDLLTQESRKQIVNFLLYSNT